MFNYPSRIFNFLFQVCVVCCSFADATELKPSDALKQVLIDYKINNVGLINDSVFAKIVAPKYDLLSGEDIVELIVWLNEVQQPPISAEDLMLLYKARIAGIVSVDMEYDELTEDFERQNAVVRSRLPATKFLMSRGKFFVDNTPEDDPSDGKKIVRITRGYNGEQLVYVRFYNDGIPNAYISDSVDISGMFPSLNPLSYTGLLDSGIIERAYLPSIDLVASLMKGAIIFTEISSHDNKEYVVVSDFHLRFFLDPSNYTLVKIEECSFESNNDVYCPKLVKITEILLTNFVDLGNDILFPYNVEIRDIEEGKVISRSLLHTRNIKINQPIDDFFFNGNIPDDAFVFDAVRDLAYMQSDSPSINALLQATVKSKRSFFFQYLSVTVGILLIILYCVLKYREHLKSKRTA